MTQQPIKKTTTPKRNIHGILLLDKPTGITSNGALQMVKRLYVAKKAGHSGSLDPIASGLLPICLGEATKFSQFLLEADKHYQLTARLGVRTDTGDSEGKVIEERAVPVLSQDRIEQALEGFRGDIQQVPSMYSAIKHQGQPLYKLARQGVTVLRPPRNITIYALNFIDYQAGLLKLEVKSSKGTYMRTLVDDLGEALGCGASVCTLRRVGAGPYTADQMVSFDELEHIIAEQGLEGLDKKLLPLDTSVSSWTEVKLSEAAAYYLRQGQPVIVPYAPTAGWVRLVLRDKGDQFLGIGEILEDGRVAPRRLMNIN